MALRSTQLGAGRHEKIGTSQLSEPLWWKRGSAASRSIMGRLREQQISGPGYAGKGILGLGKPGRPSGQPGEYRPWGTTPAARRVSPMERVHRDPEWMHKAGYFRETREVNPLLETHGRRMGESETEALARGRRNPYEMMDRWSRRVERKMSQGKRLFFTGKRKQGILPMLDSPRSLEQHLRFRRLVGPEHARKEKPGMVVKRQGRAQGRYDRPGLVRFAKQAKKEQRITRLKQQAGRRVRGASPMIRGY